MERRVRFELLYSEHAPAVKAYVLRRAQTSVADDLVAEVFMVCWRRLDELPAEPLPWLLGVARRVLSTQRRGERRRVALHQRLTESGTAVGSLDIGSGAGEALRRALEQLGEPDREVLLLTAWEGLSPTQAAAVLGVKAATVRVRLHRARRRLARALLREGGERGEWGSKSERSETRARDETRARNVADEMGEPLPCTPLTMETP
jgi:RNA polymerase sigma-70 factor (ECF subfamily)